MSQDLGQELAKGFEDDTGHASVTGRPDSSGGEATSILDTLIGSQVCVFLNDDPKGLGGTVIEGVLLSWELPFMVVGCVDEDSPMEDVPESETSMFASPININSILYFEEVVDSEPESGGDTGKDEKK